MNGDCRHMLGQSFLNNATAHQCFSQLYARGNLDGIIGWVCSLKQTDVPLQSQLLALFGIRIKQKAVIPVEKWCRFTHLNILLCFRRLWEIKTCFLWFAFVTARAAICIFWYNLSFQVWICQLLQVRKLFSHRVYETVSRTTRICV